MEAAGGGSKVLLYVFQHLGLDSVEGARWCANTVNRIAGVLWGLIFEQAALKRLMKVGKS